MLAGAEDTPLPSPSEEPKATPRPPGRWLILVVGTLIVMVLSIMTRTRGIGAFSASMLLLLAFWQLSPQWIESLLQSAWVKQWPKALSWLLLVAGLIGLFVASDAYDQLIEWTQQLGWDAIGALGEVFGAAGQILIAVLAAYIAWRQYVISKELTTQQNVITQQQTIDAYFEGISALVLDPQGQLEDWPLERAIAEGRTSAILSGLDPIGKAKILRFLSTANLLSPLRRDNHLGRPILDGEGGYQRDRNHGIRVVNLRTFLDEADLHSTDLRGVDLSQISMEVANLTGCQLSYANLCGTDLRGSSLRGATLYKALLFVGSVETATPAERGYHPNFKTGEYTGAWVQNCDFTGVKRLSEDQRYYICAWGGPKTRATVPGGCKGIPDRLKEQPLIQPIQQL